MKHMLGIIIGALLILLAAYSWYWLKHNRIAPPVDRGPVINKLCRDYPEGFALKTYKNEAGEIGGYVAVTYLDGGPAYYYEANGTLFESASAASTLRDNELKERITGWSKEIQHNYPVVSKENITCS